MAYNKEPDSDGEKKNKSIKNKSNLESTKLSKNCHYLFFYRIPLHWAPGWCDPSGSRSSLLDWLLLLLLLPQRRESWKFRWRIKVNGQSRRYYSDGFFGFFYKMLGARSSGGGDSGRSRKESSLWVAPSRTGKKQSPSAPPLEEEYENTRQSFLYDEMDGN